MMYGFLFPIYAVDVATSPLLCTDGRADITADATPPIFPVAKEVIPPIAPLIIEDISFLVSGSVDLQLKVH